MHTNIAWKSSNNNTLTRVVLQVGNQYTDEKYFQRYGHRSPKLTVPLPQCSLSLSIEKHIKIMLSTYALCCVCVSQLLFLCDAMMASKKGEDGEMNTRERVDRKHQTYPKLE